MEHQGIRENYEKWIRGIHQACGRVRARLEKIPEKRMAGYAAVLFIVSLLPLFLLGRYNVMCIDDYDYGRQVHDTWLATGSLLQSVKTAWAQNMEFYQNWQGTYISCFLMALCPMNFRYDIAWVVPLLMIGMLAVSAFVLGREIFRKWLGCGAAESSFVLLLLLFVFYQVMEAPFEGIYWYNGSTHYVLMQSVWFFTLTAASAGLFAEKRSAEVLCSITAAVLALLVGGGNLVTGLQAEIVMAFLVIYAAVMNRRKLAAVLLPFAAGSIGFLFNVLAPGNVLRGETDADTGYGAVQSVALSFYNAVVFMIRWTNVFLLLVWAALLPVFYHMTKKSKKKFAHPVYVSIGAYCVLSAMFTPTLYALGMVGLSRVDNIIQLVYYLCLFGVTAYWMGYFSHRQEAGAGEAFGSFLEKAGRRMTAVCLLLTMIVWVFTADKTTYTSISAVRSLKNGEAETFYEEAMDRYALYTGEEQEVCVAPFSERPALFDFEDLKEDPGNWLNLAVTRYYHKQSVRLAPK